MTKSVLFLLLLVACVTEITPVAAMAVVAKRNTIKVCVGVDCRVDGATDCLRMLQQRASSHSNATAAVQVKAVPCLGPCGDGPNAIIVDHRTGQRMGVAESATATREPGSRVPADVFGANTKGVFQVRTLQQADTVLRVATNSSTPGEVTESPQPERAVVRSTRAWYDRPRNERLMLQRFMHASILWGLLERNATGSIDAVAWAVAAVLWVLSNFIMKESLLETFLLDQKIIGKKRKKS